MSAKADEGGQPWFHRQLSPDRIVQVLEVMTDFWSNVLHRAGAGAQVVPYRMSYDTVLRQEENGSAGAHEDVRSGLVVDLGRLLTAGNDHSYGPSGGEDLLLGQNPDTAQHRHHRGVVL